MLILVVVVILAALVVVKKSGQGLGLRNYLNGNQTSRQTQSNTNNTLPPSNPTSSQPNSTSSGNVDDELKQLDNLVSQDNTNDLNPNDITNLQQ